MRFGTISIETLGGDEFGSGAIEAMAIASVGWSAVGTAASKEAALILTPRLESDNSGETTGQSWLAGTFSSMLLVARPVARRWVVVDGGRVRRRLIDMS